jgi:beta-aspartyl-peptidase (threonine type)
MGNIGIAIHGGAGNIQKNNFSDQKLTQYQSELQKTLSLAYKILLQHKSAEEAVIEAVKYLEDCELFNAGKGSVLNANGEIEMDAAMMSGKDLSAGAVTGVVGVKNPIVLANEIKNNSNHIFLSGQGAIAFAKKQNVDFESLDYFKTDLRVNQWKKVQKNGNNTALDHSVSSDNKFGTVGAVALDTKGNLAAATSTGGMTNKRYGRIGDSAIIGAGTYANNSTCAISCTGHGEKFIQNMVAHDVSCLMEYKGLTLFEATNFVINKKLKAIHGEGGLIAIDNQGNIAMPFNTLGMFRASKNKFKETIAVF